MKLSNVIRQGHRWLSMTFTLGVIINFFAWRQEEPPEGWITALALLPLALLLLSGLYLFMLPYVRLSRREESAS